MKLILKNKLTVLLIVATSLVGLSAMFANPVNAQLSQTGNRACQFAEQTDCDPDKVDTGETLSDAADTIIDILSLVVAAAAVIFIIIGGVKYVTSGGNQEKVTSAKNTILYAIIGLVIVIFAQTILQFVVSGINDATDGTGNNNAV